MAFFVMNRRVYGACLLACGAVVSAGCQLVSGLGKLENEGTGGAGGLASVASSGTGPGSGTSVSQSAGATSSSTNGAGGNGASSASATGTGTGGAPPELVPCGVTDNFNSGLSNTTWQWIGNVTGVNGRIRMNVSAGQTSEMHLSALTSYHECYASVRLLNGAFGSTVFLHIERIPAFMTRERINFTPQTNIVEAANNAFSAMATATTLGLAFHGSSVHFLYKTGIGTWTHLGAIPRDAWMDGANDNSIGFGALGVNGSDTVNFEDFNVDPIVLADLP